VLSKLQNSQNRSKQEEETSLAKVLVDTSRIQHNLDQFSGDHDLAPVIKSNAYGHGIKLTADVIAERTDVPFACVAALREVERLRSQDSDLPVLIIGHTPVTAICSCELPGVTFAITSLEQLKNLHESLQVKRQFHLKVETGMHRYGIKPSRLDQALSIITDNRRIELTGAFSHFSDAYKPDSTFTRDQIDRWNEARKIIQQATSVDYLHMAATSGHFYRQEINANAERVGIGLYGITGYASQLNLKPALSLKTRAVVTKEVSAGEFVGYNRTYQAETDRRIAVLPIGYQEGVDRRLSNTGSVLIKDQACPIVGKVSMNATMVDITDVSDASAGDSVTVLSPNPDAPNSVLTQAHKIGTIPYEILVHISPELERVITSFD
jgi:alanine racemase